MCHVAAHARARSGASGASPLASPNPASLEWLYVAKQNPTPPSSSPRQFGSCVTDKGRQNFLAAFLRHVLLLEEKKRTKRRSSGKRRVCQITAFCCDCPTWNFLPLICLLNMKLLSQEQRQEIRDLCRVIVRRNVELSADKVLQQLKSEYCCPEGRAPLPDV